MVRLRERRAARKNSGLEKANPGLELNDEAFPEYNSFQYWRTPLPDIDFSEISDEHCGAATSDTQEMDS